MSLQEIFYIVGTLFAIVGLLVTVGMIVIGYILYRKYKELEAKIEEKSAMAHELFKRVPSFVTTRGFVTLLPLIPTAFSWIMKQRKKRS